MFVAATVLMHMVGLNKSRTAHSQGLQLHLQSYTRVSLQTGAAPGEVGQPSAGGILSGPSARAGVFGVLGVLGLRDKAKKDSSLGFRLQAFRFRV